MAFKAGNRVKRVELLNASMSKYFGGEPFEVVRAHDSYVVDPDGGQHGNVFLQIVEGPVVERTVREIVPGTYDGVVVRPHSAHSVYVEYCGAAKTADQLTRAAAVLTALAEALRDGE